jgi:lipopolysaccharide/colanic/teichoic acid biosynthesis glycosyltransferase
LSAGASALPSSGTRGMPRTKRAFDLALSLLAAPLWLPALAAGAVAILVSSGWPAFYVSKRRVHRSQAIRLMKFRAMVRNADRIANRDTIAVTDQRFLNIPKDSPLYTPVGRWLERFFLTELPQVLHVLAGQMTIVGNRPLPQNVIEALREKHPHVEDRFAVRAGLMGPVQLVGREFLADDARLNLEIAYCRLCIASYSIQLDLALLAHTALVLVRALPQRSAEEVEELMERYAREGLRVIVEEVRESKR